MADLNRPFFDTSVLVSGLIDQGEVSRPAQAIFDALAAGRIGRPLTAWHCCLELFAVITRLPRELQVRPEDARTLVEAEILSRFEVLQLPSPEHGRFLAGAVGDGVVGGRVYDAHIAEVARHGGASPVVTDNRRHFVSLLRFGIPVMTAAEFGDELRDRRRD